MPSYFAEERLVEDGPNALTPPKTTPEFIKFLKQMYRGFAGLLWSGAVFYFTAYGVQYVYSVDPSRDNVSLCLYTVTKSPVT